MTRYKYTTQELVDAINLSTNYREVLERLGVIPAGGNYFTLKKRIAAENIDVSHLTHKPRRTMGKISKARRSLKDLLTKGSYAQSNRLRRRLLHEGVFEEECHICLRQTWNGKAIPLELDHIDGDNTNNEITNLRVICPNCHAQTSTYRGRNKKRA